MYLVRRRRALGRLDVADDLDRERGATVAAISELEAQLSSPGVAERVR